MRCSVCGGAVGLGARFCPSCGTRLLGQSPVRSRFMSVLFCDLVDSTALNERIGDEAMFALLGAYQEICQSVVDEEGGYVAKFMGDGMLAYFGYPVAMKNSATAAVSAALGIIERVKRLAGADGAELQVCAGVATGWVVVGDAHASPAARETMAIGGTVNLAARLLAATRPGSVAVGDEVCRKLDPTAFTRSFLGIHPLKGFSNPIAVWAVARAQAARSRGEFIGRTAALDRLLRAWEEAGAGQARAAEVQAPGGYGKTTLARQFLARAATDQEVFEIRGLSHRREQSFGCLKSFVAELAGLDTAAPLEAQRAHLEDFAPGTTSEGLGLLLGLETVPVAPLIRQDRIRRALDELFEGLAGAGRAVVFVDDAHWIDPDTQALLNTLPDRFAGSRVLLLATRRPEGEHLWTGAAEVIDLEL
ncbi:MAG TPA: adenylate/guanylate cyclase domain-containing protein, partial [Rubellimicrobium sp.]|nr:adenylate/guanylate cyclase domain-containing protein [Rubellimicrobium sp.]